MHEKIRLHLKDQQYRDIIARYHFSPDDLSVLRQMGNLAVKAADPAVYYEVSAERKRMPVIVTLGSGIDELQDQYLQEESLLESYMIECISMELLHNAYACAARRIYDCTGLWITNFKFLGDKAPLHCMEEIFRRLIPQGIRYNQAYMITPKKTVVFYANLSTQHTGIPCQVCKECSNLSCPDRQAEGETVTVAGLSGHSESR